MLHLVALALRLWVIYGLLMIFVYLLVVKGALTIDGIRAYRLIHADYFTLGFHLTLILVSTV